MPTMKDTLHEWKAGKLHSGSKNGPVVHSQKQAIAIGMHEQANAHEGKMHPPPEHGSKPGPGKRGY